MARARAEYKRVWRRTKAGACSSLWTGAKSRARKKGIPFTITKEDVMDVWVDKCPVFGVKFRPGQTPMQTAKESSKTSPSLDRIDPKKGYVPGNIQIISTFANYIKSFATASEVQKVADWMKENR